jgi:SHS2 domain-containing protein
MDGGRESGSVCHEPGFRTFEHTADIGVEAWGPTFAEALGAAALGLQSLIVREGEVHEAGTRRFRVQAADPGGLAVAWLSELLFTFDVHGWVFARFAVCTSSDVELAAVGFGEPVDLDRHLLGTAVKAATYHGLDVRLEPGKAQLQVILDL